MTKNEMLLASNLHDSCALCAASDDERKHHRHSSMAYMQDYQAATSREGDFFYEAAEHDRMAASHRLVAARYASVSIKQAAE